MPEAAETAGRYLLAAAAALALAYWCLRLRAHAVRGRLPGGGGGGMLPEHKWITVGAPPPRRSPPTSSPFLVPSPLAHARDR